ncbi:MAG: hypothetical protein IT536_09720 [Hyphomicrobiales bacterium]|nr:hypothetical protein [Hyphomicrobiales bacterium]
MDLPETIRLQLEQSTDKDLILEVIRYLQSNGTAVTQDVYAAIVATLQLNREIIDN